MNHVSLKLKKGYIFQRQIDGLKEMNHSSKIRDKLFRLHFILSRDLEEIKRKIENENIQSNLYSVLFSKEAGIIIANDEKGREGSIEKTNREIEYIFSYKMEELKGMNVSYLMPKLFEANHKNIWRAMS